MPHAPQNTYNSSTTEAYWSNPFQHEKRSPEPNQSTSLKWITLKVRIVGKPSTFERMNPWSNRPYISWVEDVSSRHWLQVWLGRCIWWSWQICLIPPWILWIWFRNGNEMAVIWPLKSSVQRKNRKKMLMLQTRARQLARGFIHIFWITFISWPLYFAEIIGFDEPFLNWVQLHGWFNCPRPSQKELIEGGFPDSKWPKFRNLARHDSRWNSPKVIGWKLKNALKMLTQSSFGVIWFDAWVIWDRRIRSVTWWRDFPEKKSFVLKICP